MLIFLSSVAIVAALLPALVKRVGPRGFFVGALAAAAGFAYTLSQAPAVLQGTVLTERFEWIPSLRIALSMRMDVLGWVMALIVTGVGALVLLYCRWYFAGTQPNAAMGLFSGVLLAFAGAMYALVLTDDLVILVMFWEITSILSYLLIGHFHERSASRRAALQSLMVTTLGGLVMFVGVVMLIVQSGTTVMSELLANPPQGSWTSLALALVIVGIASKSAIFPFHFWLPGAMAAPTPVSAYLHAAAMVKAGIYLIARFSPTFADDPIWSPVLISLGAFTMLLGGVQSLRETDLKRILAFGTVSQLGMMTAVLGLGTPEAILAGLALLVGHAMFKAALFLVVGIIDHQVGTRDIRELHGIGRRAPMLATAAILAAACMAGVPPTIGFAGKESMFASLLEAGHAGDAWGWAGLAALAAGSILTVAYGIRAVWGAFWTKRDADGTLAEPTPWPAPGFGFVLAPFTLAALSLVAGLLIPLVDSALQGYAHAEAHLSLWHGFGTPLLLSGIAFVVGAQLFVVTRGATPERSKRLLPFTAPGAYATVQHSVDRLAQLSTSVFQRGSLPIYVGTIFVVFVAAELPAMLASPSWRGDLSAWHSPVQLALAPLMIVAGIIAVRARKRYTGVVLVSVTGLGMVVLFGTMGAPDLALTQVLVETVTLVAFTLVLRRIPSRMGDRNASVYRVTRAIIGAAVGLTLVFLVIVATDARRFRPVSDTFGELAYTFGHGSNVVNVALVDLRGWDTMGELSVLVVAATGVASLVFLTDRADLLSKLRAVPKAPRRQRLRPLVETDTGSVSVVSPDNHTGPRAWLIGGSTMAPAARSIMLEVIVRVLFHAIMVVSIYLLFSGHNLPGGGFAGGLVAGMALVMRYVAGGRYELGAATPTDAGRLLGLGMLLASGTALLPIFLGDAPLTSYFLITDVPWLGHIEIGTPAVFDAGVYLVVIGLTLDVLRSLGAEVDRQMHEERESSEVSA